MLVEALRLRYSSRIAPSITPQMLPMPPRMTMQSTRIEMLKKKLVGNDGADDEP